MGTSLNEIMLDDPLPPQWVYVHSAFQKWAQQHEGTCELSEGACPSLQVRHLWKPEREWLNEA